MKRALRRMKNEVGLRPMKRTLRNMKGKKRASLHVPLAELFTATKLPLRIAAGDTSFKIKQISMFLYRKKNSMRNDKLSVQSMDFAVAIINLVKSLKEKRESIISSQVGRSGTSIGANIREAQYAHGKADFIAKLQIALKESNETGYWLELLYKTNYLTETEYKSLDSACTSIRVMLISSITTAKERQ